MPHTYKVSFPPPKYRDKIQYAVYYLLSAGTPGNALPHLPAIEHGPLQRRFLHIRILLVSLMLLVASMR